MSLPSVTPDMVLVFGLIFVALVLFVTEIVSSDITAIGVLVSLAILEPFTGVPGREAISGFASPATVTIIAMYILSDGIQRTGIVERLGVYLARITGGDETRLLAATVGTTGISAGIINNTPVVAVFIPMITGLAERAGISRSKLLLPLSYAAMLGGTLTLIGTSTNILASDLARQQLDRGPIGMFEFTPLGIVVFLIGTTYLMTIGRKLTPARIKPDQDLTEQFDLESRLSRLTIPEESELVGRRVDDFMDEFDETQEFEIDFLQIDRGGESFHARTSDQTIEPGDTITVRASLQSINRFSDRFRLRQQPRDEVTEKDLVTDVSTLAEVIILPHSRLVGETVASSQLQEQFDTSVLAVIRGGSHLQDTGDEIEFQAGDTLLLYTTLDDMEYLQEMGDVALSQLPDEEMEMLEPDVDEDVIAPLTSKTPIALGILGVVIGIAALGLASIVIAALGGVVAMVVTGCLDPSDIYDAVSWNIIFLLAGVLPLGIAMQRTGGAEFIAAILVTSADILPILAVLALFYLLTGMLANIITPVASVVLMIPIAVDTATRIGGEPFSFVLGVMFAASAAFTTPIGYQTNLMVYGPGGYKFTDYVRVGAPLQLMLAVVVTFNISILFGV